MAVLPGGEGQGEGGTNSGGSSLTILSSITGHASVLCQLGPDAGQNIIEANYSGNPGLPATFIAYGVTRDPSQPTRLSGLVLDNSSGPIGGAVCSVSVGGQMFFTTTDAQGQFHFTNTPAGPAQLRVDGATATNLLGASIPINSFPSLEFALILIPNAENSLPSPVLLPRLNLNNQRLYYGTNDFVLTCEGMEGLKMTIKAGSMRKPDGTLVTPDNPAYVSLNQVHHDSVPMPIPDGASPPFAWTLQPGGATFNPPVQIEYPNMSGLPAGTVAYFLSYNHDTRRFEIIASGHVLDDSTCIVTDPGAGLSVAGWGCNCPPYSVTESLQKCVENNPEPIELRFVDNIGDFSPFDYPEGPKLCGNVRVLPKGFKAQCLCTVDDKWILNFVGTFEVIEKRYWSKITNQNDIEFVKEHESKHLINKIRGLTRLKEFAETLVRSFANVEDCKSERNKFVQFLKTTTNEMEIADQMIDSVADYERCDQMLTYYGNPIPFVQQAKAEGECCAPDAEMIIELADNSWSLSVNGQTLQTTTPESFFIPNVSAPDQFGPGGPGTRPDFLSDDFLRLTGTSTENGVTRYAFSEFFQIRQGQTVFINNLTFTDIPPRKPASLIIVPQFTVMTNLLQTNRLRVIARYPDGTTNDVAPRTSWTSYRISNPNIATVDANGVLTPKMRGMVFITAVNEGATAVVQLDVSPDDQLTQVTGQVVDTNGVPVAGATVRIYNLAVVPVLTDASGNFVFTGVPTGFGALTISVRVNVGGQTFTAFLRIPGVPGGQTIIGTLTLKPIEVPSNRRFAAGYAHTVALREDGSLWAWGDNRAGQLGDGTTENKLTPQPIEPNVSWKAVAAGGLHTVALRENGTLWTWGDNAYGQLGDGTTMDKLTPQPIETNVTWKAVAAGFYHTVALREDGTLWAWGYNRYGQLGDGTTVNKLTPQPIEPNVTWKAVAAGLYYTVALHEDDTLWTWGDNSFGQLGDGTTVEKLTPQPIQPNVTWKAVAAGDRHMVALREDGTLWTWGYNELGQLGDGTTGNNRLTPQPIQSNVTWKAVAAGNARTVALREDGTLWTWGYNAYGQLGDGTRENKLTPQPIQPNVTWKAVAAGSYHTVALREDDILWTWGNNSFGQLGDGTTVNKVTPQPIETNVTWKAVAAGGFHTVALRQDDTVWTWGNNSFGQLGDGTTVDKLTPQPIETNVTWKAVSAGNAHTVALREDGTLWAWGTNGYGQLGDGTTVNKLTPQSIQTNVTWRALAAGYLHTVALREDRTLWAWGYNNYGQLGDGTMVDKLTPQPIETNVTWKAVAAGYRHTLALREDGTLWAWGYNRYGQLGDGTPVDKLTPQPIEINVTWKAVAAGYLHTMALREDNTLWAWGYNEYGQLGDGTTVNKLTPQPIGINVTWKAVAAGYLHTMALREDGALWTWGDNSVGQLGIDPIRQVLGGAVWGPSP